jgi:hypothetical protein
MKAAPATTAETAVARLGALSAELTQHGWKTRLQVAVGHVPCLFVQNPAPGAAVLAEHIYAAPRADAWWFWWSWAEPISDTVAEAASIIVRVLRAAATP